MRINPSIFKACCRAAGLPVPVDEYQFHETRKWRFDFAWPVQKVALEIDGGNFIGGAHVNGARIRKTHEKENEAQAMGWRIFHTMPESALKSETMGFLQRALR